MSTPQPSSSEQALDLDDLRRRARDAGRTPGEVTDGRTYAVALFGAAAVSVVVGALGILGWSGLAAWLPGLGLFYGLMLGGSLATTIALQVRVWVLGDRRMRWVADGYAFATVVIWLSIQDTTIYQGVDVQATLEAGRGVASDGGVFGVGFTGLVSLYLLWHLAIAVMAIGATLAPGNDRLRLAAFGVLAALALPLAFELITPRWFDAGGLTSTYTVVVWALTVLYAFAVALWIRGSRARPDVSRAAVAVSLVFGLAELVLQAVMGFGSGDGTDAIVLLLTLSLSVPGTIEIVAFGQALAARSRGEDALLRMVLGGLPAELAMAEELEDVATTALVGASGRAPFVNRRSEPPTRLDIDAIIERLDFELAVQPIVRLADGEIAGYEALARFEGHPDPTPDVVIEHARRLGRGVDLELALIRGALRRLPELPDGTYLGVNLGVDAIMTSEVLAILSEGDPGRLVVEVTEHLPIDDYAKVLRGLEPLRETGVRLAIDDAGAGFASLRHVIQLRPDLLKLDRSLVAESDRDPARRAVIAAMVDIAVKGGMDVIGEGVERAEEAATLRALGVPKAQGYLFGRPAVAPAVTVAGTTAS